MYFVEAFSDKYQLSPSFLKASVCEHNGLLFGQVSPVRNYKSSIDRIGWEDAIFHS